MSDESKLNLIIKDHPDKFYEKIIINPPEKFIKPFIWNKILPEKNEKLLQKLIDFKPKQRNEIVKFPNVEIFGGDVNGLLKFMQRIPQTDPEGHLRYLLCSGVAIELITGFKRLHHDLDIVIMAPLDDGGSELLIDAVIPQRYWVGMQFDPKYLQTTAYQAQFKDEAGKNHIILTVHPAIMLVQKLSDWLPKPRRPKDIEDAAHIFSYWMESLSGDPSWNPIIQQALQALPEAQRTVTSERLRLLLNGKTAINHTPFSSP